MINKLKNSFFLTFINQSTLGSITSFYFKLPTQRHFSPFAFFVITLISLFLFLTISTEDVIHNSAKSISNHYNQLHLIQ